MNILQSLITSAFTVIIFLVIIALIAFKVFSKLNKKTNNETLTNCKQRKANCVLLSINNTNYDNENNPFEKSENFSEIYKKLKNILNNDKIQKIIIDVDKFNITNSQVDELEDIFKKLNEKKEVISISTILTNDSYEIAMLANKIYLENTVNSTIIIRPYYRKLKYMKSLFDKIGIHFNILHIGDYKSYGENFAKNNMSNELKENMTRLYENKLNAFIEKVKIRRKYDISQDILDGKLFFKDNKNLIDGRINKDTLYSKEENLIELKDYTIKKEKNKSKNTIAIIPLEGTISSNELSLSLVKNKLEKLEDVKNLKGIVLEINSPGGSAYESSLIHTYIKENIDVPIYVAMKDLCASGGYFISTVGSKLFANNSTLTGSIGVVSLYPTARKLFKNIGINYDGISKGKYVEYGNINEYLKIETKEVVLEHINSVYKEFKSVVMTARNFTDEYLEPIAGGRVWTAKEAKEIKLIDDIKTTNEVIEILAKDLNLQNYKTIIINKEFNMEKYIKNKVPLLNYSTLMYQPLFLAEI